jgi:filamentous hemagglutinin
MERTVAAERAIKQEAITQATLYTDAVYRSATGAKKIMLEKCDSQGQNCNAIEVDMKGHQLIHSPDGQAYLF